MSEYLSTVWSADPHTLAKHRILAGYLKAWMPILARGKNVPGQKEVLFVDGFAGPGRYEGGEDGSPVVAMKVALEHAHQFPMPVSLLFIERDRPRFDSLLKVIDTQRSTIDASSNIKLLPPEHGDCETVLQKVLEEREAGRRPSGPLLAFLDQFGYSDVSMDLIARIMSNPSCEVFTYMDWRFQNAFMTDPNKATAMTKAFGDESWKPCLDVRGKAREHEFVKRYFHRLREAGNTRFVWNFAMCGEGGQLLYWLFFCTNNLRGLEEMKKAMWQVDDKGSFRFSDGDDPNQLTLAVMTTADNRWLADHLHKRFLGTRKKVGEIKEYVLVDTPCYLFKESLALLEQGDRLRPITPLASRRRGTFPYDEMEVEFVRGGPTQGRLF